MKRGKGRPEDAEGRPVQIAVVGRPNAGKSTLINRLIGEDRLLTGPEAGITRDSIAVDWRWRDLHFRVFDTAGLRRKARVDGKLEKLAVGDALRAIRFAEVVVVVLDATTPFEKQDLQIADLVESEGRAIVIALDKWDLIEDRQVTLKKLREDAERLLPQIRGVALVPVSGLTGEGIDRLAQTIVGAYEVWNRRVPTAKLNQWLAGIIEHHPPPAVSGRRIKLRYLTQAKARPPSFVAFCSRPEALPEVVAPVPGQRAPRGLQAPRRADPPLAQEGRQPLRGEGAEALTSGFRPLAAPPVLAAPCRRSYNAPSWRSSAVAAEA